MKIKGKTQKVGKPMTDDLDLKSPPGRGKGWVYHDGRPKIKGKRQEVRSRKSPKVPPLKGVRGM